MLGKHARSMVLLQHSSHQRLARPPRNVTFFIVWGFIQYRSGKLQIKAKRASSMRRMLFMMLLSLLLFLVNCTSSARVTRFWTQFCFALALALARAWSTTATTC